MKPKILIPALVIAVAAAVPAGAGDEPDGKRARTADVQVVIKASPLRADAKVQREQAEIFRVLQGGDTAPDAELCEHLWRVAASLADRGWTPPKVTVQAAPAERTRG